MVAGDEVLERLVVNEPVDRALVGALPLQRLVFTEVGIVSRKSSESRRRCWLGLTSSSSEQMGASSLVLSAFEGVTKTPRLSTAAKRRRGCWLSSWSFSQGLEPVEIQRRTRW